MVFLWQSKFDFTCHLAPASKIKFVPYLVQLDCLKGGYMCYQNSRSTHQSMNFVSIFNFLYFFCFRIHLDWDRMDDSTNPFLNEQTTKWPKPSLNSSLNVAPKKKWAEVKVILVQYGYSKHMQSCRPPDWSKHGCEMGRVMITDHTHGFLSWVRGYV